MTRNEILNLNFSKLTDAFSSYRINRILTACLFSDLLRKNRFMKVKIWKNACCVFLTLNFGITFFFLFRFRIVYLMFNLVYPFSEIDEDLGIRGFQVLLEQVMYWGERGGWKKKTRKREELQRESESLGKKILIIFSNNEKISQTKSISSRVNHWVKIKFLPHARQILECWYLS